MCVRLKARHSWPGSWRGQHRTSCSSTKKNREHWPDTDEVRALWDSEEGQAKLEKHLSVEKIREYFRQRPALGAPDIDGWQAREHIAAMLMDKDEEFHLLFRKHLILPYAYNDFIPEYSDEHAGGRMFAHTKANGGVRPIKRTPTAQRPRSAG